MLSEGKIPAKQMPEQSLKVNIKSFNWFINFILMWSFFTRVNLFTFLLLLLMLGSPFMLLLMLESKIVFYLDYFFFTSFFTSFIYIFVLQSFNSHSVQTLRSVLYNFKLIILSVYEFMYEYEDEDEVGLTPLLLKEFFFFILSGPFWDFM